MTTNDNPEEKDFDELGNEDEEETTDTETEGGDEPSSDSDQDDVDEPEEGSDDDDEPADPKDPMAKFKGKSAEEVIEMYKNLEHRIDSEAMRKAQELLTKGGKVPAKKTKQEEKDEDDIDLTEEQIKNMTPREFAKWTDKRIALKATQIARDMIERSNEVRENVQKEIKEVTAKHPHLKTNPKYREIVLDRIEAAKSRGKTLTLKEACRQVDEAMDIKVEKKPDDKPVEKKKKPRTTVEKTEGGDSEPPTTEEDKVKNGILNAGGKSPSALGGLGI